MLVLAYDPFKDHKTSIRAGFGIFSTISSSHVVGYWLQPPFLAGTQTSGLTYPYPLSNIPAGSGTIPTNGTLSVSNGPYYDQTSTPYTAQWNF